MGFPKQITVQNLAGNEMEYEVNRWQKGEQDRLYIRATSRSSRDIHCYDLASDEWIKQRGESVQMRSRVAEALGL